MQFNREKSLHEYYLVAREIWPGLHVTKDIEARHLRQDAWEYEVHCKTELETLLSVADLEVGTPLID